VAGACSFLLTTFRARGVLEGAPSQGLSDGDLQSFLSLMIFSTPGKLQNKMRVVAHTAIAQV